MNGQRDLNKMLARDPAKPARVLAAGNATCFGGSTNKRQASYDLCFGLSV